MEYIRAGTAVNHALWPFPNFSATVHWSIQQPQTLKTVQYLADRDINNATLSPPPPKKNYVKYYYATVMNCQVRKSTGNFTIHGGGRKRKLKRKTACSHLPTLPNKSIWEPSPLIQPEAWAKVIINVQENVHRTAGKQLCPIIQAASWRVRVKMVQLFLYTPEKHMVELRYRSSHS